MTHALVRMSPKGEDFIGRCLVCGQTDLPITAVRETCPNPDNLTIAQVFLKVLEVDK